MLNNYLLIAFRNLRKNSTYSLLNILGLGLSTACCIVIFLMVHYHLSFDTYHKKADRTIRMVTDIHLEGVTPFRGAPNPMSKVLRSEFSYIEKAAMQATRDEVLISVPNTSGIPDKYKEDLFAFVEPELFDILDFQVLQGDLSALREPNTAVLTEKMARKYYGTADAIGKTFRYENKVDFRVVGILRDLPNNTDYSNGILASWSTRKSMPEYAPYEDNWGGINGGTYCLATLQPGHTMAELEAAMPEFRKKYRHPDSEILFQYKPVPLTSIHLDSDYGTGNMQKSYLWALTLIGIFLLITACVNFINMATAQALKRAREVGVRKSLGSTRGQLFWQFMFETSLIVLAGVIIGIVMAKLSLPSLNAWTEENIEFSGPGLLLLAGFMAAMSVAIIFLAGAYPGLVQARFQPVDALRGHSDQAKAGGFSLRRILVTTQFTISQILIIGAAVVTAQIQFARDADWGFRPGVVLTVPVPEQSHMKTLREQVASISGVKNVSLCYQPPASSSNNQTGVRFENRTEGEPWMVNNKPADDHYLETFGLKLVAGRNLMPSDTVREFLVNETFVKKLNFASPQEVVGKKVDIDGDKGTITGVVADFHNWELSQDISAISISTESKAYSTCAIELQPGNPEPVLAQIKKVWENNFPEYYYESTFMDDQMAEFLESESIIMHLVRIFAGIAIFIGCLGLYGLASFMVMRKTKEIGIRKTLGATVPGILWLFGREYIRLIVIAFVIATPLAWWAMNAWLQNYVYRTPFGPGIFALALAATFVVALLTVGFQSLQAAVANPVKSLKSE
ncbi:MAG TPA: ABC transporter permease [Saprospiraceae bacterium]|nr:ABC transporter permease [Saprospiraceae bacterium]HPI08298.1 ABC transporter permease [Saprospiraceae bacterium]